MKGIILSGEYDNRLHPLTLGIPKQLIPIYDKPMIYYPIEMLVGAGITDIMIITSPQHTSSYIASLNDGSSFNAKFSYSTQTSPDGIAQALIIGEHFMNDEPVCLTTGDCILVGKNLGANLRKAIRAAKKSGQATIFVCRDYSPDQYGRARTDGKGICNDIVGHSERLADYSITGVYVFPKGVAEYAKVLSPSERGRLEVTSLNYQYLKEKKMRMQVLGSDFKWLDTNSFDSLVSASKYFQTINRKK